MSKNELLAALEHMEKDQGIPKETILQMVEQAMVSAYRKHAGQQVNVVSSIDTETGQMRAWVVKNIVEEVSNPVMEITAEDAAKIRDGVVEGSSLRVPIAAQDFARIAAQTAKQVLVQKVRETQREGLYAEYKPKEGTLLNGSVLRILNRNIVVDLGRGAEGTIPMREQVRREHWAVGDRVRALILKVERGSRGPEILLSRAHADFVKRLFEQEVPEIYEKTVDVVAVVREPGFRSKVVVRSHNLKVDPIGACVGVKGSRVRPIINELQGERIDLVGWSDEAAVYIANAMAPVKPLSVKILSHEARRAEVLVADDQLSLAIGRSGQNVRLANKLTNWNLDVRSEGQKREAAQANAQATVDELSLLEGVGPKTAEVLQKAGWADVHRLSSASVEDLTALSGVGDKMAEKIIESARARVLEITEEKKRTAVEPLAEDEEVNASSDETNPPTNTEEDPAS